jgi:hypothetical protein
VDEQNVSGNRWEPAGGVPGSTPHGDTAPIAAEPSQPSGSTVPPASGRRTPAWLTRARALLVAGAAALVLMGLLGGFLLGRLATGGHDHGSFSDRDGQHHGFLRGPDEDPDGRSLAPPGSTT